LTPAATAFALSIFSYLLKYSFHRVAQLVVSAVQAKYSNAESADAGPSESVVVDLLERGKSIVSILQEHGVLSVDLEEPKSENKEEDCQGISAPKSVPVASKQKKRTVVDRRRRRRGGGPAQVSSEDEYDSDTNDSLSSDGSLGRLSSDEDLSALSEDFGDDDLKMLGSSSDSSSSESEEEVLVDNLTVVGGGGAPLDARPVIPTSNASPVRRTGRRNIVIAANFSMPPPKANPTKPKPGTNISSVGSAGGTGGPPKSRSDLSTHLSSSDLKAASSSLRVATGGSSPQPVVYSARKLVA